MWSLLVNKNYINYIKLNDGSNGKKNFMWSLLVNKNYINY